MDRLMLEEHTTPKDSFDLVLMADAGGKPVGVEGRGSLGGL